MESSVRRLRVQKPFSDCTNTLTTAAASASAQSSTASTAEPKLASAFNTILAPLINKNDVASSPNRSARRALAASTPTRVSGSIDCQVSEPSPVYSRRKSALKGKENSERFSSPPASTTRKTRAKTKEDAHNNLSRVDVTPIASTPPPHIPLSSSGGTNDEVSGENDEVEPFEPRSVYCRRKPAQKRKENTAPHSCPPALKIRNTWDNIKEDGHNNVSKSTASRKKKKHELPQDFIDQQRAYFEEIDKYELPEEEAEEWELD